MSRFKITFARVLHFSVTFLDCDLMNFCNSFRSSSVSLTVYFCDFIVPLFVVL